MCGSEKIYILRQYYGLTYWEAHRQTYPIWGRIKSFLFFWPLFKLCSEFSDEIPLLGFRGVKNIDWEAFWIDFGDKRFV